MGRQNSIAAYTARALESLAIDVERRHSLAGSDPKNDPGLMAEVIRQAAARMARGMAAEYGKDARAARQAAMNAAAEAIDAAWINEGQKDRGPDRKDALAHATCVGGAAELERIAGAGGRNHGRRVDTSGHGPRGGHEMR